MILDEIVEASKKRVELNKTLVSDHAMQKEVLALPKRADFPFEKALAAEGLAFICEVKKASPSKGIIAADFPYLAIAKDYEKAGAAAVSVLTEPKFFQGNNLYLSEISRAVKIPVLRKDFIVDGYQIYEAKLMGAAAVLLIGAVLDFDTLRSYLELCNELGLSALVEAHTAAEVAMAVKAGARVIGVNNRNLKTFKVDLNTCLELRALVPENLLFVAESGISTRADIEKLEQARVDAVLIGESMMKSPDKVKKLAKLKGESLYG